MKNINGVETFISGNLSGPLHEWFCCLLLGQPKVRPHVSERKWESWLKFIEWHGISSVIFTLIQSLEANLQPPAEIYAALRRYHFANAAHIMIRRTQLEHLLGRFETADIRTLVLKGAALGEMLYGDVFQRPTADIDILVLKDDYNRARRLMLENGYRSKRGDRSLQMGWSCDEEFIPAIDDMNRQYVVELHWALTSHAQLLDRIETRQLFDRSEQVDGMNRLLSVLGPIDALIFACLHLFYKHINELRLIWLYDVHLLADQIEKRDLWVEVIAMSQLWQGRLALKNCLELATQWFGTPVPELVRDLTFKPASLEEVQLYNMVIFQLEHSPRQGWLRKHLFQISRLKGRDKIHYLNSRLFPSRQEIEANYPRLREWPGPLIHICRFILMIVSKK